MMAMMDGWMIRCMLSIFFLPTAIYS